METSIALASHGHIFIPQIVGIIVVRVSKIFCAFTDTVSRACFSIRVYGTTCSLTSGALISCETYTFYLEIGLDSLLVRNTIKAEQKHLMGLSPTLLVYMFDTLHQTLSSIADIHANEAVDTAKQQQLIKMVMNEVIGISLEFIADVNFDDAAAK